MAVSQLFSTPLWQSQLEDPVLLEALAHSCHSLAAEDRAGQRWARDHRYRGYTSYASLNDLPARDPAFAALARWLVKQAGAFAGATHLDLAGRKPRLDSLWVNILKPGGAHSGHIHPRSIISGTLYVEVPTGAGAIRFEDPRLPMFMHAPPRLASAPEPLRSFVTVAPAPGLLLLWESWLRHEVLPGSTRSERVSISFNFA
ncbi:TIGR02466 family protein [Sandarakinorhabdus rubra]|uniref:TIGR02466 family protein n=1 Tax=Sandarakinorhabdus rubra TaxID=2672568 RepID=UPI0013DC2817|nr:TIGR02466 family protein [Sandarakinorhabdus rubra]